MSSKQNWRKVSDEKKISAGKKHELDREWEIKRRYGAYRNGEFWIGLKPIQRWYPKRMNHPGDGIFVNAETGEFEAWKDGQIKGKIFWKTQWKSLVKWGQSFGLRN